MMIRTIRCPYQSVPNNLRPFTSSQSELVHCSLDPFTLVRTWFVLKWRWLKWQPCRYVRSLCHIMNYPNQFRFAFWIFWTFFLFAIIPPNPRKFLKFKWFKNAQREGTYLVKYYTKYYTKYRITHFGLVVHHISLTLYFNGSSLMSHIYDSWSFQY